VALGGIGELDLFAGGKGAKKRRERKREGPDIESVREGLREATSEHEAPVDPGLLPVEQSGDGRQGEAVFFDECEDDADFVHGTARPWRAVGQKDARLDGGAGVRLYDDGDFLAALVLPAEQALETVENLVGAVGSACDANRQRGQVLTGVRAWAAQMFEGRPQGGEGGVEDFGHRHLSKLG